MTTTTHHHRRTNVRTRRYATGLTIAIAAMTASGPTNAAVDSPPPWDHCAFADHPAAADLGPLVPAFTTPSAEVDAILLGQTVVGTDCSIYDLPV